VVVHQKCLWDSYYLAIYGPRPSKTGDVPGCD
jgi:hypothetical protein